MQPGFFILISILLDSSPRKLHGRQSEDFMEDIPAPKRAWRVICTVCYACGKQFPASYAFDKHQTSGYLIKTVDHVPNDGSTRAIFFAGWRQPMSAILQKLTLAKRTQGTLSK